MCPESFLKSTFIYQFDNTPPSNIRFWREFGGGVFIGKANEFVFPFLEQADAGI